MLEYKHGDQQGIQHMNAWKAVVGLVIAVNRQNHSLKEVCTRHMRSGHCGGEYKIYEEAYHHSCNNAEQKLIIGFVVFKCQNHQCTEGTKIPCCRSTVYKIMKENGIRLLRRPKWKQTTNSKHDLPIAPNLLNQYFNAELPNTVWVGDITYNWTEEGWVIYCYS